MQNLKKQTLKVKKQKNNQNTVEAFSPCICTMITCFCIPSPVPSQVMGDAARLSEHNW